VSVSLIITTHGIAAAVEQLERLTGWSPADGAQRIAPILESQTRRRIESEKRSPRGVAWAPNRTGTSTLLRTGRHLRDSIANRTSGPDAIVEAHWQHAHVHQTGMTIRPRNAKRLMFRIGPNGAPVFAHKVTIPARPFIGLSTENHDEIVEELNAMLADLGGEE
jgi:phage gpG-like protein